MLLWCILGLKHGSILQNLVSLIFMLDFEDPDVVLNNYLYSTISVRLSNILVEIAAAPIVGGVANDKLITQQSNDAMDEKLLSVALVGCTGTGKTSLAQSASSRAPQEAFRVVMSSECFGFFAVCFRIFWPTTKPIQVHKYEPLFRRKVHGELHWAPSAWAGRDLRLFCEVDGTKIRWLSAIRLRRNVNVYIYISSRKWI